MKEKIIAIALTALLIVGLVYVIIGIKTENNLLTERLNSLEKKVEQVQKVEQVNNHYYFEDKKSDQQLIKDSARSQLLFEKPGLVEIKINKSFDEYMQEFNK